MATLDFGLLYKVGLVLAVVLSCVNWARTALAADFIRDLQHAAIESDSSPAAHWGPFRNQYRGWSDHTNRLIPVYTFGTRKAGKGIDLVDYSGANSAFRSTGRLKRIFGRVPTNTLNPEADYLDQTDLASIQRAAFAAGKKHVFLFIFDGMDWQTTWAAATYKRGKVTYRSGRGAGLHFQDYSAKGTTQFGWMVTTPLNQGTKVDVNVQQVLNPGGKQPGGYNVSKAGPDPWTPGKDPMYLVGKDLYDPDQPGEHAFPDSAATATAMTSGVKTYNDAINVDVTGNPVSTIAHEVQERGLAIGIVTSVPISHATPACSYAHNVDREDYQDLTRDLVGLPSVVHFRRPLPGVDVLIGAGFGDDKVQDADQGDNFVPGNRYITAHDLQAIDVNHGGKYIVATRTPLTVGRKHLLDHARAAADKDQRLFGFFGADLGKAHLPFRTADGDFHPAPGKKKTSEGYTLAELSENPTLADMTQAALIVLEKKPQGFWMMVEAGDVDWANHDNNLDNSIGAVLSGDAAVKVITDWVDKYSNWTESLLIVTADHGHYLVLDNPELLCDPNSKKR